MFARVGQTDHYLMAGDVSSTVDVTTFQQRSVSRCGQPGNISRGVSEVLWIDIMLGACIESSHCNVHRPLLSCTFPYLLVVFEADESTCQMNLMNLSSPPQCVLSTFPKGTSALTQVLVYLPPIMQIRNIRSPTEFCFSKGVLFMKSSNANMCNS